MSNPTMPGSNRPSLRLVVLGLLLLLGLGLFFWLAPKAPVVAKPVETEPSS